jgi:hypothetical protein
MTKLELKKLRKMRFGDTLTVDGKLILRNKFGFSILSKGVYIGKSPKEAYENLVNFEEDPYDDAKF